MVDELKVHANAWGPFRRGSAHLTCDDVIALHVFAALIGLKREWFQPHPVHPHYDLTPQKLAAALKAGAILVPARVQAITRLRRLGVLK